MAIKSCLQEIYEGMVRVLASIHGVDIEKVGLSDFGRHGQITVEMADVCVVCRSLVLFHFRKTTSKDVITKAKNPSKVALIKYIAC